MFCISFRTKATLSLSGRARKRAITGIKFLLKLNFQLLYHNNTQFLTLRYSP